MRSANGPKRICASTKPRTLPRWRSRTKPSTPRSDGVPATRLDEVLPRFDVSKTYSLAVDAPAPVAFEAMESYDMRESRVTRFLMALRGYRRLRRPLRTEGLAASLARRGFVPLGGRPGRELVFGLV